jgi:hypothetical protein
MTERYKPYPSMVWLVVDFGLMTLWHFVPPKPAKPEPKRII